MNEAGGAAPPVGPQTAGGLLRAAREKQGLHIAALAASIKVSPKKLEMLEADRLEALPDATFTRALAQTVCRALKIDPVPVLSLLPPASGYRLESLGAGLNTPFRERPGAMVQREGLGLSFGPWFWITGLIVLAAIGVFAIPSGTIRIPPWSGSSPDGAAGGEPAVVTSESAILPGEAVAASGAATTASAAGLASSDAAEAVVGAAPVGSTVVASAASEALGAASGAASRTAAGVLQVRASGSTWVEISDARGRSLVARVLAPGEAIALDGEAPFRVRIGNAGATHMSFRGQPLELAGYTRDNVARFELK